MTKRKVVQSWSNMESLSVEEFYTQDDYERSPGANRYNYIFVRFATDEDIRNFKKEKLKDNLEYAQRELRIFNKLSVRN